MRQLSLSDCAAAKPPKCNYQAQRGASFHFESHFSQICIPLKWKHLKCWSKLSLSVHLNRDTRASKCASKGKWNLVRPSASWESCLISGKKEIVIFFFTELSTTVHLRARKVAGNKKGREKRSLECSQNKRFCPHLQLKQGARAL